MRRCSSKSTNAFQRKRRMKMSNCSPCLSTLQINAKVWCCIETHRDDGATPEQICEETHLPIELVEPALDFMLKAKIIDGSILKVR